MITVAFCFALVSASPALQVHVLPDLVVAAVTAETPAAADPTIEQAPELFGNMVQSFRDGNWPVAIGSLALLLFLLVGLVNGFLSKMTDIDEAVRKTILEWSVAGGGMLSAFGLALLGGAGWLTSVVSGFLVGTAAAGFWQLVVKKILKAVSKKASPPAKG